MFLCVRPYEFPEVSFVLKIRPFLPKSSSVLSDVFEKQKESEICLLGELCQGGLVLRSLNNMYAYYSV